MSFLTNLLHKNLPYDLSYKRVKDADYLKLFIDQHSDDSNGKRVAGVLLSYLRDPKFDSSYSLALEPSGNIDALAQLLGSQGLHIQIDPFDSAPYSRWKRMKERGGDYAGVGVHGVDAIKAYREKYEHGAGLVSCYVEDESGRANYGQPVFDILQRTGFLSEASVTALKTAIETFEASDRSNKFDTGPLEKKLTGIFRESGVAAGGGTPGHS